MGEVLHGDGQTFLYVGMSGSDVACTDDMIMIMGVVISMVVWRIDIVNRTLLFVLHTGSSTFVLLSCFDSTVADCPSQCRVHLLP